ncbi:hypothetical protein B0H16DRAFT_235299 [Mycena metata]|uniref:Uncharacterized protein n=1 Tax=Mycena metata TaxID=1033252 RepID=A0AAD7JQJ0_9AGAR|nr:hypothetical protein B0H16DRAFT_235299 [Mycena metata]
MLVYYIPESSRRSIPLLKATKPGPAIVHPLFKIRSAWSYADKFTDTFPRFGDTRTPGTSLYCLQRRLEVFEILANIKFRNLCMSRSKVVRLPSNFKTRNSTPLINFCADSTFFDLRRPSTLLDRRLLSGPSRVIIYHQSTTLVSGAHEPPALKRRSGKLPAPSAGNLKKEYFETFKLYILWFHQRCVDMTAPSSRAGPG